MVDIKEAQKRLAQLESQARYDTDRDIKIEINYYREEIKRLKTRGKGA